MELALEGIWHRDLATRNILVSSLDPVNIKVSDFGLAHRFTEDSRRTNQVSQMAQVTLSHEQLPTIPIRWSPPEVLTRYEWSEKSDVWSFGVTVWEIFSCGGEPFPDKSNDEVSLMSCS
jgi:FMS-like tyrosine kinase 1